jgi:hypothetical protein
MVGYLYPTLYISGEKALMHLIMSSALWCTALAIIHFRVSNFLPVLALPCLGIIASIAAVPSDLARTRCSDCLPSSWLEYVAPAMVCVYLSVSQLTPRGGHPGSVRRLCGLILLSGQQILLFVNPKLCILCYFMGAGLLADSLSLTSVGEVLASWKINLGVTVFACLGLGLRYMQPWSPYRNAPESVIGSNLAKFCKNLAVNKVQLVAFSEDGCGVCQKLKQDLRATNLPMLVLSPCNSEETLQPCYLPDVPIRTVPTIIISDSNGVIVDQLRGYAGNLDEISDRYERRRRQQ